MSRGLSADGQTVSADVGSHDEATDRKLTVLLLIKDQAPFTLRWLTYASFTQFPFKVLIADGSADDQVADALSDPTRFPGVDVEYVRYPQDRTLTDFYKKKVDALERVTTPYVVKTCNDDFYTVDGLRRSIRYLDANLEYSCGRGEIFNFAIVGHEGGDEAENRYGYISYFQQYKPSPSNAKATAAGRVETHCAYYVTTWHDVHRTANLASVHRRLLELSPSDLRLCDHLTDSLTVAAGKVYRGSYPYMLHQSNPADGAGASLERQFPTYRAWTKAPWWRREADHLFDMVAEEIARRDGIAVPEARQLFQASYIDVFLRDYLANDSQVERTGLRQQPARSVGRKLREVVARGPLRREYRHAARRYRNWRIRRTIEAAGWSEAVMPVARFLRTPPSSGFTDAEQDSSHLEGARV